MNRMSNTPRGLIPMVYCNPVLSILGETVIGKYVLAWLLLVPTTVLMLVYLVMHH